MARLEQSYRVHIAFYCYCLALNKAPSCSKSIELTRTVNTVHLFEYIFYVYTKA